MPRPTSIDIHAHLGTAFEDVSLTPRTPHSRSGRAEEGHSESEYSHYDDDDDDHGQSSADPLLTSRSKQRGPRDVFSSVSLLCWCLLGASILCLAGISYQWPDSLRKFLGIDATFSSENTAADLEDVPTPTPPLVDTSLLISYENYTTFPLTSTQYLAECYKMTNGWMTMEKYWDVHGNGVMDVPHVDDDEVCSSSITYMLDGERGLFSDLALIAQAAALAREVCSKSWHIVLSRIMHSCTLQRNRTFLIDDTYWNRGNWTDHFKSVRETQPGPEPGCKPPPPQG